VDFQDQVYEDSDIFFCEQRASVLEHFAPIFFIYSIELELHDRKVCFAHLCYGLTRVELSFLGKLRSIWVVVIGIELLCLACPGLGLGRDYVAPFIHVSPCHCLSLWLLILLMWRLEFGITGMETMSGCSRQPLVSCHA
jgi:hypothetical protein